MCYITCAKTRLKVILHYVEEGWLGRAQNRVNGVVFRYDPDDDTRTKIKDVPEKDVLARIEGCWQDKVYFILAGSTVSLLFLLGLVLPIYVCTLLHLLPSTINLCCRRQRLFFVFFSISTFIYGEKI
jgi:hypothetical protein